MALKTPLGGRRRSSDVSNGSLKVPTVKAKGTDPHVVPRDLRRFVTWPWNQTKDVGVVRLENAPLPID
eukprot:1465642-Pyramimonas_sp.AAC.1